MKKLYALLLAAAIPVALGVCPAPVLGQARRPVTISGAGASFPYPLYAMWADRYEKLTGNRLNYQSIGSGGGVAQIKARTVDFGATDAPLSAQELAEGGLIQFPLIVGGIVPVVNVDGVEPGRLVLNEELLVDIFLGRITNWSDPRIATLNPDVSLPSLAITVVRRADGSGSTWLLTNYLSLVSEEWKTKVGAGSSVAWPVGVGGRGNEGVAAYVQRIAGAIGYVEYAYAVQNEISHANLVNKAGKTVSPGIPAFQAAAANADWAGTPGYAVVLVDQPGDASWPITGASFILVHKSQTNAARARAMLEFFDWCLKHGADTAVELDYVPLPANVVALIENTWSTQLSVDGISVWRKAATDNK